MSGNGNYYKSFLQYSDNPTYYPSLDDTNDLVNIMLQLVIADNDMTPILPILTLRV